MVPLSYEKIIFDNAKMTMHLSNGIMTIKIHDVYTMAYKKWSFLNFLTMRGERIGFSILYIATKTAKDHKDIIQIYMPFSEIQKLPKVWYNLIEFYERGKSLKIDPILYKGIL